MSESNPRLFRLLLEVSELERAVTFYSELLGTTGQPVRGGRHYFDCGGVIVGLVDVSPAGRAPRPITEYLYFAVPNLDVVYRRAASLVRPWGERSFYVADPYGNRLCFVDDTTLFFG